MLETVVSGLVNTMSYKVLVGFSPNYTSDGSEMNVLNFGCQKVKVPGHSE